MKHKCIFCLEESDEFHTIEHIVPESLGNTDDILKNAVCDKCQNYFGQNIENYILTKTPIGLWRTISGTLSKKGKKPSFNGMQTLKKTGKLDDYHECTDRGIVIHPYDNESIIEVEITDEITKEKILAGEKKTYNIVLTPKMLIYIGRFLGKMALEYWYKQFNEDVFNTRFNDIRNYTRYGTIKKIWPIFNSRLERNLLNYNLTKKFEEERDLYSYQLYEIEGNILYCFNIGEERYSIIITERLPKSNIFTEQFLSVLCNGTISLPNILYYNLE